MLEEGRQVSEAVWSGIPADRMASVFLDLLSSNTPGVVPSGYTPTYLENKWVSYFGDSYHTLKVAALFFVAHEIFLFGRYIPYYVADLIPQLKRYQIQADKRPTKEMIVKCLKYLFYGQVFFQLPLFMGFYPFSKFLGMTLLDLPFPSVKTIIAQSFFFLFTEDAYHFFTHWLMHKNKYLYNKIHRVHHEYQAPFGITAEYAHPLEILVLGLGFFLGPTILLSIGVNLHMFTMLIWVAVRLIETVDVHAGFSFPWSVDKYIPFWGGADFHDYHHMRIMGNYSSTFRWLDWVFGTDRNYKNYKKQLLEAKEE